MIAASVQRHVERKGEQPHGADSRTKSFSQRWVVLHNGNCDCGTPRRLRSLRSLRSDDHDRTNEKADMSTWQRSGHLYLALTRGRWKQRVLFKVGFLTIALRSE